MTFKLGKLAATRPYGLSDLSVYASGKLPAPPASANFYNGVLFPIDGNDTYGDCVMAGTAHLVAAWNAEVKEKDAVPTGTQVVTEYFELTGGQDSGLNESDTLQTWHTRGLFGQRIAGYAPINHSNITEIHQAIAFYGGSMFGIQCPDSAQQQFAAGKPWTVVPGAQVDGGHCIIGVGYDSEYVYCATWGGIAPVSYPFLSKYLDEAYAVLPHQFVEAGKGPSIDIKTLQADLASL